LTCHESREELSLISILDFHPILSELWGCLGIRLSVEVEGSKPWVMIEAT